MARAVFDRAPSVFVLTTFFLVNGISGTTFTKGFGRHTRLSRSDFDCLKVPPRTDHNREQSAQAPSLIRDVGGNSAYHNTATQWIA